MSIKNFKNIYTLVQTMRTLFRLDVSGRITTLCYVNHTTLIKKKIWLSIITISFTCMPYINLLFIFKKRYLFVAEALPVLQVYNNSIALD